MRKLALTFAAFVLGICVVFGQEFSSRKHLKKLKKEVPESVFVKGDVFEKKIKFSSSEISFMGGAGTFNVHIEFEMYEDSTTSPLCISFNYRAENWLFTEEAIFYDKHNGNRFNVSFRNPSRRVLSDGGVEEWCREKLSAEATYFLYSYANGKTTRALHVKVIGDETYTTGIAMYNKSKNKASIKNIMKLYNNLKG